MNHSLLWCLLSNTLIDKLFWAKTLEYTRHFTNYFSSIAIGGKTMLNIWSGRAAQDYNLLQVFECPAYFRVKDGKLNL